MIPIIDLKPWFKGEHRARKALCEEINRVAHEVGFFYITNHGIQPEVSADYLKMVRRFFGLPTEVKRSIDKHNSPQFRGWEQLGSELTNNQVDYREQIDIGVEAKALEQPDPYYLALIGPNQWPSEADISGFNGCVSEYFDRLAAVARELLRMMSVSLGLAEDHIEQVFGRSPSPYLKLIRYPKTVAGGQGVGVHKDSGFLTLLLQDENSGLEAQANDNSWFSVAPVAGSLVVNMGELLQIMTQNYFIATPHRVRNAASSERFSSAFFYSPDLRCKLDPLPIPKKYRQQVARSSRHSSEGLMASKAEMARGVSGMASAHQTAIFGDQYWQRWVRSYPNIAARFYPNGKDPV